MRRRGRYLILFGAIVMAMALLMLSAACGAPGQDDDEKPNIVLILADDMRADDLEHMPQTHQHFAEEGLTFKKAFVTHSLCCPSRASILRGQYTHNHKVLTNDAPEGGFEKFRSVGDEGSTVATWLKSTGYKTVLIGKYLNGYPSSDTKDKNYVPPGWDRWHARLGELKSYYDYELNENGIVVSYGSNEQDYQTDVLADKAKDYVRRTAGSSSPFFMYLAPSAPHPPFTPAPRHKDAYTDAEMPQPPSFDEPDVDDKPAWVRELAQIGPADTEEIERAYRNRLRMLLSLDEMVAGLIEELQGTGDLDNTYIFFTSDNGFHLNEHRLAQGKRTVYEEDVRVPLAVCGPGVSGGESREQMALNIDLAPTFAALAGLSAPAFVDGRSLVPLLSDTPPEAWRSAFLLEHWSGGGEGPAFVPTYTAVRTEVYKYVEYNTGAKELYDLSSDPYELESLHRSADPVLIESLKSRLEALKACVGESCREAEDAP
jgi:N-acetylglucosamine-6-sulfatase